MRQLVIVGILILLIGACAPLRPLPTPTPTLAPTLGATPTWTPTLAPSPSPTPTCAPITYVVPAGDTLADIAALYGITVDAICLFNELPDCSLIYAGQELLISCEGVRPTTPTLSPVVTHTAIPADTPTPTLTAAPEDPYELLLREYPQIEEYIRLVGARDTMPDPEAMTELELLISEYPETPVAHEAHLSLARYFASIGDWRAYDHYGTALALDSPPTLKLEWARYLQVTGRREEAYAAFREIFRRFPDEARPALVPLAANPLTLATDLLAFGFPDDVLAVLPGPMDSPKILALRAAALMALGRTEEALATYEAWLAIAPDSVDARLGKAGALSRLGRSEEALALYAALPATGAQLARGEILEGLGRRAEALEVYLHLSDLVAWWRAAGILEGLGRRSEAVPLYEQVARSSLVLGDDAAYRLWVLAKRLGDTSRADVAREMLEGFWPNYYTLLVRDTGFRGDIAPGPATPAEARLVVERAHALDRLGYPEWAISELVYAARATDDPAMDLVFGQALYERGAYREANRIGVAILSRKDSSLWTLAAWRLVYPKAYPQAVDTAAREFGVDPLLIWSVMRQESSFYPEAVSVSYAQGLMQVIPSTRDLIARALGTSAGPESMFDPGTSIRFGAYYLGEMVRRFGGDVEYAVAAYNGGPTTVQRTLDYPMVRDRNDFYRWLAKAQSREFVNRVMLNYAVYQWLERVEVTEYHGQRLPLA